MLIPEHIPTYLVKSLSINCAFEKCHFLTSMHSLIEGCKIVPYFAPKQKKK